MDYIPAKNIVIRTKNSSWFGTDYTMNIYRGCSHGCIYCDSRSDCYRIEEFDRVRAKDKALQIIRDDLRRKVKRGVVGTGAMSDPYNPFEAELKLTRHSLELLDAFGFGCAIATKSDLIVRDSDILRSISQHSPVICKVTVTTRDDELSKKIEPFAPPSSRRFTAIKKLSDQGIYAGILLMPVLPFIEDDMDNVLGIVEQAAQCGAKFIYPAFGMTLRQGQREWYYRKLEEVFPGRGLRERYERQYGWSYNCTSKNAKKLWQKFAVACQEAGIHYTMRNIIASYKAAYEWEQLRIFPDMDEF